MSEQRKPLCVGDVIHGFAQGAFGRDHYDCTRIEATGPDWIVARDADGDLSFASGKDRLLKLMWLRDEDPCIEEGGCRLAGKVQLTQSGGFQ